MIKYEDMNPAFPHTVVEAASTVHYFGISIRDYFAAKAMQSRIDRLVTCMKASHPVHRDTLDGWAEDAYAMADAMIRARNKYEPTQPTSNG